MEKRFWALAFGLGAAGGVASGLAESGGVLTYAPLYFTTPDLFFYLTVAVLAPFVEEILKPIGLYLIKIEERPTLTPRDWMLLGILAGFGFKLLEDLLYALTTASVSGSSWGLILSALRGPFPLHMLATGITGFGMGLWDLTGRARYFLMLLVVAMLLHGLFNLAVSIPW